MVGPTSQKRGTLFQWQQSHVSKWILSGHNYECICEKHSSLFPLSRFHRSILLATRSELVQLFWQHHIRSHHQSPITMLLRTLVLVTLFCAGSAKLNVPHPRHIQIESLTPFDAPMDLNGQPTSFTGAVVIDGVSQANNMDMNCNNKFCQMIEYAVVWICA